MFKINRKLTAYKIVGKTFGAWLAPLITGFLLFLMKLIVSAFLFIDKVFF